MNTMKTIEKIRQNIEEIYDGEAPAHDQQCEFEDGYFTGISTISNFLDTLESEKPVQVDLEEAAVDIADELLAKPKDYVLSAKADYWNGAHDGIIAGAKWQKEQMISALKNDGDLPIEFIDKFHEIDRTAFQNGQANMKEQMMKEAIHYVVQDDLDSHGASYNIPFIRLGTVALKPKGIGVGDKVCIIIVKEDEK